jgi:hypothetical protein
VLGLGDREVAPGGFPHHGLGQGVFGARFQGGRELQGLGLRQAIRVNGPNPELPFGQRAGLVESHHTGRTGALEGLAVAHQDAVLGGHRGGVHGDQRDRQA